MDVAGEIAVSVSEPSASISEKGRGEDGGDGGDGEVERE